MKSSNSASILTFILLLAIPSAALAAPDTTDSRYFIPTTSALWRGAFGARHQFPEGFTTDLNDFQLGVARLAGLKPVAVEKFSVLEDTAVPTAAPTPLATPSQPVPWGIRLMLDDASLERTTGGEGISIALIDTGVDRSHPDLVRRITGCADLTDPVQGFVDQVCDDLNGHGTHVAGILVADGGSDGAGTFGFAPGASLSVYRACGPSGSCFSDDIAVAITHAVDAGANIIVLGMGGEEPSEFIADAVSYATERGVLLVAGAGNDGPYDDSVDYPARYAGVVAVAAIDNTQTPAEFSSRGLNASTNPAAIDDGDVEFAAPGVNIESTYPGGIYAILSGTSMAAPHVAGLAASLWQAQDEHPAEATRAFLASITRDIAEPGSDAATGWGMPVLSGR